MASPPSPPPPPAPTTIFDLGDDLLREIFLRLPALPTLVRAACACRAFRRAARTFPSFRRSFRERHAPPVLALFLEPNMEVVPLHPCPWRRRDPDLVAADFFDVRHGDALSSGWKINSETPSSGGYLILDNWSEGAQRVAAYSPLTQVLDLFLDLPPVGKIYLEFYTLLPEDGRRPSHVVCVRVDGQRAERAAVFSSDTMEWQIFPETTLQLTVSDRLRASGVVHGLVYWRGWMHDQIVVLETMTFQFSLIDLPTPLKPELGESTYKLGETKDGKLCIVDIKDNTIVSWFLDNGSVLNSWITYKNFPLRPIVRELTGCSMEEEDYCNVNVDLVAVIDGFVYLCIFYLKDTEYRELYLSICLETSDMCKLYNGAYRHNEAAHPYVMAWPPSLVQSKQEESETEDDDPKDTEETSSVLIAALQSFSQALMNADKEKEIVAELDAFLRPAKDGKCSLISRIATLDVQMTTARNRILRISE
ncbi:hypothetical protein VPH35_068359 [Triticum aestivum]|uniref:uncharacterized protein isoform X3 n=1 Tax=Triticum aestivum TaxID=4565 RepID=UPI001D014327|nr:uncharacterized protein LOC123087678 isoform X3 [Triticum aestivum]